MGSLIIQCENYNRVSHQQRLEGLLQMLWTHNLINIFRPFVHLTWSYNFFFAYFASFMYHWLSVNRRILNKLAYISLWSQKILKATQNTYQKHKKIRETEIEKEATKTKKQRRLGRRKIKMLMKKRKKAKSWKENI